MAFSEITFSKGGITVTVYARDIDDSFANKIFIITNPITSNNQTGGPLSPKIVDLLRLTRTIQISGFITPDPNSGKTANQIKKDLITIIAGGVVAGGNITLTYDGLGRKLATNADATSISGYMEKLSFKEDPRDEPSNSSTITDYAKFSVQITFVEGASAI